MEHFYNRETGELSGRLQPEGGRVRVPSVKLARDGLPGACKPYQLVPSVTTILGSVGVAKALMYWAAGQGLAQAFDSPPFSCESAADYRTRLWPLLRYRMGAAAELGTAVHKAIEEYLRTNSPPAAVVAKYVEPVVAWLKKCNVRPLEIERTVVGRTYAGRMDLFAEVNGRETLCDFKTQGKPLAKATTYPEWGEQLAAYRLLRTEAGARGRPQLLSAIVLTGDEPGVVERYWTNWKELKAAWLAKLRYYQITQNYWPPKAGKCLD